MSHWYLRPAGWLPPKGRCEGVDLPCRRVHESETPPKPPEAGGSDGPGGRRREAPEGPKDTALRGAARAVRGERAHTATAALAARRRRFTVRPREVPRRATRRRRAGGEAAHRATGTRQLRTWRATR